MPPVVIDLCESPSPAKRLPLRRRSSRLNPNNDNNSNINNNEDDDEPLVPRKSKSKASRLPKIRWPNGEASQALRQLLSNVGKDNPFDDTPPPARSTRSSSRGTGSKETSFGRRLRKFKATNDKNQSAFAEIQATKPKPRKTKTKDKDNRRLSFNDIMEAASSVKKRGKESASASRKRKKSVCYDSGFDSDIQVVEKPVELPMVRPKKAAKSTKETDDDELSVVGTTGTNVLVDCPHAREDCVVEKFTEGNHSNYCDKCYCFVCDVPAKDCKSWKTGLKGKEGHCHATRKDPKWLGIQKETRQGATFRR